jgi:hypothetical protein
MTFDNFQRSEGIFRICLQIGVRPSDVGAASRFESLQDAVPVSLVDLNPNATNVSRARKLLSHDLWRGILGPVVYEHYLYVGAGEALFEAPN